MYLVVAQNGPTYLFVSFALGYTSNFHKQLSTVSVLRPVVARPSLFSVKFAVDNRSAACLGTALMKVMRDVACLV